MRLPLDEREAVVEVEGRRVRLTNLQKPYWPTITKGALLQYYADVSAYLLPHLRDRAMVMRRYPDGAAGPSFFMKRAPVPRPDWLETVAIEHDGGKRIDYPLVQDVASLLFIVNLGCIDLNPWYARRDDVDRPDYVHFDLDPGEAPFAAVRETARLLLGTLGDLGMTALVKTSGSRGLHVYVPIVRAPLQGEVWGFAKTVALAVAAHRPELATGVYARARRPPGRVLIDYNQNRWGATLASVYSVRPTPTATVSTPLGDGELERVEAAEFTLGSVPARLARVGDLWAPLAAPEDDPVRFDLSRFVAKAKPAPRR